MKVIIDGAGEVGSHLAKLLRAESNDVTVIDDDAARLAHLSAYADVETLEGNPTSLKLLREAGCAKADLFIAVYPFANHEINIVASLLAKQLGSKKVVARVNSEEALTPENRLLYKEMGIELMFYPEKIAADEIVNTLKNNASSETMEFANGKLKIGMFKLDDDSDFVDMKFGEFIKGVSPEESALFRVIAVAREGETIIPSIDMKFHFGDVVYTISTKEGMAVVNRLFGKESYAVKHVMILGGNDTAAMVARGLATKVHDIKVIEKDKNRCLALSEKLPDSVMIVNGDGRNSDFLYEESIRDYDAFVALTDSDETNVLTCVIAKKFGVPTTVAEVENIEYIRLAEEMGVDVVINRKLLTAGRIFKFTLSGKARFVKYMSGTNAEVIEYTVAPGSAITKAALKDLDFPKNAIIGGVLRGSESFIAVGSTKIEAYDRVAIFALPQTIRAIDKFFK